MFVLQKQRTNKHKQRKPAVKTNQSLGKGFGSTVQFKIYAETVVDSDWYTVNHMDDHGSDIDDNDWCIVEMT
jgi:hypothetical protein